MLIFQLCVYLENWSVSVEMVVACVPHAAAGAVVFAIDVDSAANTVAYLEAAAVAVAIVVGAVAAVAADRRVAANMVAFWGAAAVAVEPKDCRFILKMFLRLSAAVLTLVKGDMFKSG